jgi:signal transduction histidine kinase
VTGLLIDRLRAEEDGLRHANAELAARTRQLQEAMDALTQRTREVFAAEEQLRRADRLSAIGQMTTGLAHEIRNPLASIRGTAEILGDGALDEARRIEFSRILLEETQRLDRVLGSFLDYARAQKKSGAAAETGAPCSLGDVIERLRPLLGRPLADSRVELALDVPSNLPPLAIGADLLQQVLLNLALNAIQAMSGGGRLTIEARRDVRQAVIRVRDTGPGIPPALAGRVFDPFFTTKPQGVGLGLSIVHKIVTGCGGQVALETNNKEGACFRLTLPLAE